MKVVTTFAEARAARDGATGVVPTMGALHEGHLTLIDTARQQCDTVLVSLFVNPLQFGDPADLDAYPRDRDRDAALAAAHGADVLFVPSVEEMYPDEPQTRITVTGPARAMEGAARPGHFEGVAIAVTKLLAGIQPGRAYFGRKDAQQVVVVRRLVRDLSFPVEIVPVPLVRDHDGLALSSRNSRLDPGQRMAAVALSRGLLAAADLAESGERTAALLEEAVTDAVAISPGIEIEYAELADAATAEPIPVLDRAAFLAAAAHVGPIRIIDNVWFSADGAGFTADRGTRLDEPSKLGAGRLPGGD